MGKRKKSKYIEPNYEVGLRIANIVNLLYRNPHGVSRDEIQRSLGISVDTIRRYKRQVLPSLINEGEELIEVISTDKGERWRIRDNRRFKDRTVRDILSLYMAGSLMSFLRGTPARSRIKGFAESIKGMIPEHMRKKIKDFEKKIWLLPYGPKDYKEKAQVIEEILGALIHDEVLEIERSGSKGLTTSLYEPLTLLMYKSGLYLIAKSRKDGGEIRAYRVEMIKKVKRCPEFFKYPKDYNPGEYFKNSFGMINGENQKKIKIFFDDIVKETVSSRSWHPSQKISKVTGGIEVEFTLEGTTELISWILSYGFHTKIISPPEIKNEVKSAIEKMKDNYK